MSQIPCEVIEFMHCRECVESVPKGESPESWARLSVGFTPIGLQVWCVRHQKNVIALDFLGQQIDFAQAPRGEDREH